MYRIPGKNGNKSKGPVIMLHGVSNSSNCFIVNMCTKPPAFILADANFDVWFLNNRGTHISREHETLDPENDEDYW